MNENVKIFVGLLVPAATIVAFFFSIFLENYVLGVFLSIFGISSWLFFTFVMKSYWHQITGNVIIVFGALLALSIFLDAGIERNMFGGLNFLSKGIASSTILLFFSILLGILFKNMAPNISTSNAQIISRDPVAVPAINNNDLEKNADTSEMSNYYMEDDPDYLDYDEESFPGYEQYFQEDEEE